MDHHRSNACSIAVSFLNLRFAHVFQSDVYLKHPFPESQEEVKSLGISTVSCVLIIHILWFHSHWVASWITKLYANKDVQNTIFKTMRCHMNHDYIVHYGQFPQSINMTDSNALQTITENLSVTDISVPIVVEVLSRFLVMMGLRLLSGRLMKMLTWMNSKISGDFLFLSNNEGENEFKEAMQISYDNDITNLVPHALGNILNKYFKILLKWGCFMH